MPLWIQHALGLKHTYRLSEFSTTRRAKDQLLLANAQADLCHLVGHMPGGVFHTFLGLNNNVFN